MFPEKSKTSSGNRGKKPCEECGRMVDQRYKIVMMCIEEIEWWCAECATRFYGTKIDENVGEWMKESD